MYCFFFYNKLPVLLQYFQGTLQVLSNYFCIPFQLLSQYFPSTFFCTFLVLSNNFPVLSGYSQYFLITFRYFPGIASTFKVVSWYVIRNYSVFYKGVIGILQMCYISVTGWYSCVAGSMRCYTGKIQSLSWYLSVLSRYLTFTFRKRSQYFPSPILVSSQYFSGTFMGHLGHFPIIFDVLSVFILITFQNFFSTLLIHSRYFLCTP